MKERLRMRDNVGEGFKIRGNVVGKRFSKVQDFAEFGFFFDNFSVGFDVSSSVTGIGESINQFVPNFVNVFSSAKFFEKRKNIDGRALSKKFENGFENNFVFSAIEIIDRQDRGNFRNDTPFLSSKAARTAFSISTLLGSSKFFINKNLHKNKKKTTSLKSDTTFFKVQFLPELQRLICCHQKFLR